MVHLLAVIATVSFAGFVPPHRAADGKLFTAVASSSEAVEAGLKACAVTDYAALRTNGDGGARRGYRFALAPVDAGREACVTEKLSGIGKVEAREQWGD